MALELSRRPWRGGRRRISQRRRLWDFLRPWERHPGTARDASGAWGAVGRSPADAHDEANARASRRALAWVGSPVHGAAPELDVPWDSREGCDGSLCFFHISRCPPTNLLLQNFSERGTSNTKMQGCPTNMRLLCTDDHGWHIQDYCGNHNHSLSDSCGEKYGKSHRQIDPHTKELIRNLRANNGSISKVYCILGSIFGSDMVTTVTKRRCTAYLSKINRERSEDDVQIMRVGLEGQQMLGIIRDMKLLGLNTTGSGNARSVDLLNIKLVVARKRITRMRSLNNLPCAHVQQVQAA